jgi:membrane protein YdbS with pleckstrin-like domain
MNCPKCGEEVVELAGFCHKCGTRLDLAGQQFPPNDQWEAEPVPEAVSSDQGPAEPTVDPAAGPVEKFKQAAAASSAVEEEPERDLWQGCYSSKAMVGAWALSGLITIGLLVLAIWGSRGWLWWSVLAVVLMLWLYQLLKLCYRRMNVRYRLSTQRFIHETGILRRVTDRIEVIDMDDITFEQSFLERFDVRRTERRRRGLHIESI